MRAVATETQTPPDLAGVLALATISAAIGGKFQVQLSGRWVEPCHLQIVSVLNSGERKSATMRTMTAPIDAWERRGAAEDRKVHAVWQAERRVKEARLKHLEQTASAPEKQRKRSAQDNADSADKPHDLAREIEILVRELASDREPRVRQVIADDVTPERAKQLLCQQGGSLAILAAEGAFFANICGRYSEVPNLDVLLYGHAGDAIRVSRTGRDGEYVPRPALTLGVCIQPQVVEELGKVRGFLGKGAAARLLPSIPVSLLGRRKIDPEQVPDELVAGWDALITTLLNLAPNDRVDDDSYAYPRTLELAPEAQERLREYRTFHERQLGEGGAFAEMQDWGGKLPGAIVRIAGILHVAQHPSDPDGSRITVATMERAVTLGDYFAGHAAAFSDLLGERGILDAARKVLRVVRVLIAKKQREARTRVGNDTPLTVSRRAVYMKMKDQKAFQRVEALEGPLSLLEELGYLRVGNSQSNGGGRPSITIELNPHAQNHQNHQNPPSRGSADRREDNDREVF